MSNQESSGGVTRRALLKSTALGSLALAAGGLPLPFTLRSAAAAVQQAAGDNTRIVWGACSVNCGSRCALRLHVRDDEVVYVETDNTGDDRYGDHQVRACLRGRSIRRRINHPDRLNYPMKRVGKRGEGKFERISWQEALDTLADRLKRVVAEYGEMGSGWHEWPLVLFTVLGQCVVGATLISGLVWLELADQREARQRLVRSMFFIWLLMGIGFLASVMHLGSPLRAFNSLNRVGASALSNEIASGALFFAVGGFWWLLAVLEKMPAALGKIWLVITLLLGLLFVLAMTRVYQIDTVPTWYTGYTTSAFFLTVLLSGPLFAALLLQMAKVDVNGWFIAGLSVAALVISAAVIVMQSAGLSTIHSSVQQAASLLPNYGRLQALRLLLLALGLGCWLCPLIRRQPPRAAGLLAGLVLVLIAECIGRGLFYGLHMTVGMAVAG